VQSRELIQGVGLGRGEASTVQDEAVGLHHGPEQTGICIHASKATTPSEFFALKDLSLMATTRYFYAVRIHDALLPQNKQILCRNFTIKQHWTILSRETLTDWQRATS
jgi:hypothetical protein